MMPVSRKPLISPSGGGGSIPYVRSHRNPFLRNADRVSTQLVALWGYGASCAEGCAFLLVVYSRPCPRHPIRY